MLSFCPRRNSQEIPLCHTEPASRCDCTPADRTALEALQAFTQARTATRAIDIAVKRYPDTCSALQNAEADRDQAPAVAAATPGRAGRGGKRAITALHQVIQGLRQHAGSE